MKNIEAVIFDMDGVIFDTERVYLDIWTKVFKKYKYKLERDVYISVMGTGRKNVMKVFTNRYGEDLPILDMYKEKDEMLLQVIESGQVPMKKGANEILKSLKDTGLKIALATSAKRDRLKKQLKMSEIEWIFDTVVCGDDVINGKPNPEIFLKAAKNISVNPENCIVIEDSAAGIKAAHSAKMIAIHVEDLKKANEEILNYCYKNFNNLFEIKEYLMKQVQLCTVAI